MAVLADGFVDVLWVEANPKLTISIASVHQAVNPFNWLPFTDLANDTLLLHAVKLDFDVRLQGKRNASGWVNNGLDGQVERDMVLAFDFSDFRIAVELLRDEVGLVCDRSRHSLLDYPAMALLCLTATLIDHVSSSPAEILLGRKIQDNLPQRFNRKPEDDQHYQRLHERQEEQKRSFDQHVRPLPMVFPGQSVNVRNSLTSRWEAGRATDVLPHRSIEVYLEVYLEKGSHVRHN